MGGREGGGIFEGSPFLPLAAEGGDLHTEFEGRGGRPGIARIIRSNGEPAVHCTQRLGFFFMVLVYQQQLLASNSMGGV